jgi:MYXO-CTERM domain-containing protein
VVSRDGGSPFGRRDAALAALLLAALVATAFHDVLFAGRTLSPAAYVPGVLPSGPVGAVAPPPTALRDLEGGAWVDEPAPYLVHRALAGGRLPLWNADVALGAPLAANPNMAAWSPLQLAANLWPTPLVQDVGWVLRVYLLALFTALLAGALGCRFPASLAAAAALALSGETLDWVVHQPLNTDVFVPAALAAALWTLRGRARARLWLALAVAAALLGVKPQSALTAAAFGALLLAAAALDDRRAAWPRAPGGPRWILLAPLLGAALAAIALLPFVESWTAASGLVRAGRSAQSEWTLPLRTLPGLVAPWALRVAGAVDPPQAGPPHAGATVLLLALLGAWRARRRAITWVLVGTAFLYLTRIFGLVPVRLAGLPVLGAVSFVKYCFPLYLALALLAALALDPGGVAPRGAGARARSGSATAVAGALAIAGELLWLGLRPHPPRIDPYAAAPYVSALRALVDQSGGRISGPVSLAPPLVSAVLGFRDLRAIDVLTPRQGYDFVAQQVASSEGITWILADPDPLIAATAPGADVADLRWILSAAALDPAQLPVAARTAVSSRRLLRLFDVLDAYHVDTRELGGGIDELDGERRFHWSCALPCRFRFDLRATPRRFAAGFAASAALVADVSLTLHASDGAIREQARLALAPGQPWQDVWLDAARTPPT